MTILIVFRGLFSLPYLQNPIGLAESRKMRECFLAYLNEVSRDKHKYACETTRHAARKYSLDNNKWRKASRGSISQPETRMAYLRYELTDQLLQLRKLCHSTTVIRQLHANTSDFVVEQEKFDFRGHKHQKGFL